MASEPKRIILKAFSEGKIGWREACRRLDIESFSELEGLMKSDGFSLYQPDPAESAKQANDLDIFLYGEEEV